MGNKWKIVSVFLSIMLTAVVVWALITVEGGTVRWALHPEQKEINTEDGTVIVDGIPVIQRFLPLGYKSRPGITRKIRWIVIHETANHSLGSDSEAHYAYLMKVGNEKNLSWHYTVDDHQIIHMLPDYEVGWHAGDGTDPDGGNMCGIGIEMAVNDDGNFEKTLDNSARLTAYLLREYGLGMDAVKMHGDFSGKNCPMTLRNEGRWDSFVSLVEKYYIDGQPAESSSMGETSSAQSSSQ